MIVTDLPRYQELASNQALIFDRNGQLVTTTNDPLSYLISTKDAAWHAQQTNDIMAQELSPSEKTNRLCKVLDFLIVWSDRYLGTPHVNTANTLDLLCQQGLYTGYVPVVAKVSWCTFDTLTETNTVRAEEEIDVRPILDALTQSQLDELDQDGEYDEERPIKNIVQTCIDRCLLTYNPISPWIDTFEADMSIDLTDYIENYRQALSTPDDVAQAIQRLDTITQERINELKQRLDIICQTVLQTNA